MRSTPTIWIVHRDAGHRIALARMIAAGDETLLGGPTDKLFDSAAAPATVVLGVCADFELELNFVHRVSRRLSGCHWIVLGEAEDLPEIQRLFDTLRGEFFPFPPPPRTLPGAIAGALRRREAEPLSRRRSREELSKRFARWFRGLDLPDLMRALDPAMARIPLLARGEPGTGRGLLARYAHVFGPTGEGQLARVSCHGVRQPEELLEQIAEAPSEQSAATSSIWLQDVDRLSGALQLRVLDWIEFGLPEGRVRFETPRWLATAGDQPPAGTPGPELDPQLAEAFAGLALHIPPLRRRPHAVEPFVADTTLSWCRARGEQPRRFSDEAIEQLQTYPWPGNLRELESTVVRTLARCSADPVLPVHLLFQEPGPEGVRRPVTDVEPAAAPPRAPLHSRAEPGTADSKSRPEQGRRDVPPGAPSRPTTAPTAPPSPGGQNGGGRAADEVWRRIVSAVAHEVRNPLVSIRTFSELMGENFDDEKFRERFRTLVGADIRRIEDVVTRLEDLLDPLKGTRESVNVALMLEELLDERREEIQSRRLLVLKELDRSQPFAFGRPEPLRRALAGVLGKALSLVPERGDVYLASKHHSSGLHGRASVRILLRYHTAEGGAAGSPRGDSPPPSPTSNGLTLESLSLRQTVLEYAVAEAMIRAQGGSLTVDNTDAQETVILIDLEAPS